MLEPRRTSRIKRLVLWGILVTSPTVAIAQMGTMGRSLGGYGAATIGSVYRSRSGPMIPYGGGLGGFVPYQDLESRAPDVEMSPRQIRETPIGGAGRMGTPIGGASRTMRGRRMYIPLNLGGGMDGSLGTSGRVGNSQSPGFGYPFRRPPSLVGGG